MRVDDVIVDDITRSKSQPMLTAPGRLLSVMNSNGAAVIQRPASATSVFPVRASSQDNMTQHGTTSNTRH